MTERSRLLSHALVLLALTQTPVTARAAESKSKLVRTCKLYLTSFNPWHPHQQFAKIVLAARDPNYRPPWKEYVPNVTSDNDLVDDPQYFYYLPNVWNNLLEERFEDTAKEARHWHSRREPEIEFPDPSSLPAPKTMDVPTEWPDDEAYARSKDPDYATDAPAEPTAGPTAPRPITPEDTDFLSTFEAPPARPIKK